MAFLGVDSERVLGAGCVPQRQKRADVEVKFWRVVHIGYIGNPFTVGLE
jgi:hypothetical protein